MQIDEQSVCCGFVAMVGPTNAGKSTLLNSLIGEKLSIVSDKPQTTMRMVKGIYQDDSAQVIFVDAPGFNSRKEKMSRLLNRAADIHAQGCDVVLWVFDISSSRFDHDFEKFESTIKKMAPMEKSFLALNKVDKFDKRQLLPVIDNLSKKNLFKEIIPLSALREDNTKRLIQVIKDYLPQGPRLYDKDIKTDRDVEFRICEIIREKVYQTTGQEIPYSVRVEIEQQNHETASKVPVFFARIHVDSASQKPILIGKKGQKLKEIGTRARADIEKIVGQQICLKLNVHHDRDWRSDPTKLHQYLELGG